MLDNKFVSGGYHRSHYPNTLDSINQNIIILKLFSDLCMRSIGHRTTDVITASSHVVQQGLVYYVIALLGGACSCMLPIYGVLLNILNKTDITSTTTSEVMCNHRIHLGNMIKYYNGVHKLIMYVRTLTHSNTVCAYVKQCCN